jgi:Protein of unknown function (DUF3592)/Mu transposase, C-terminal
MLIVIGVLFALAGGVAVLAGLSGMGRARRLRRTGMSAWATTVPSMVPAGERADGSSRRTLIQYALPDGRVIEQISPGAARKAASMGPGQKVLVWYDPADPQDVLVYGREGRHADWAFTAAGGLVILAGAGIAAFLH